MPRKIRKLIQELKRAGFADRGGRGSDRNYEAKPYQERAVRHAITVSESGNADEEEGEA